MSTMTKSLVGGLRRFHADERGDVMQNMCVAGVGGLICLILGKILKQLAGTLGKSMGGIMTQGSNPEAAPTITPDSGLFGS